MKCYKKFIIITLIMSLLLSLLFSLRVKGSEYGYLTEFITYDGVTGKLWIPQYVNKNTGFIWCMPGSGGYTYGTFSAYDYVSQGLEKPRHVVFFVEYTDRSGNYIKQYTDKIPDIINQIKVDYKLNNMGDEIYYYGFSKGVYLYSDIARLGIWDEAILNDGWCGIVSTNNLKRVVVIQAAENHIYEYNQMFKGKTEYYLEDFRGKSAGHAKVNAWGATNKKEIYAKNTYYDPSMDDPKYGLDWFGAKNLFKKSFDKADNNKEIWRNKTQITTIIK